jgi:hypothetical protein
VNVGVRPFTLFNHAASNLKQEKPVFGEITMTPLLRAAKLAIVALGTVLLAGPAATETPQPTDKPILTVSGKISTSHAEG